MLSPFQISRSVRSLNRLRQIAAVLTQHGFGHVVQQLQLTRYVPVWLMRKVTRSVVPHGGSAIGQRLAQVCADLGPTFVKLAQTLTTRPDLVPADVRAGLATLQDDVPPFPTDEAIRIIETDLGATIADCFAELRREPLASGSIGQVYAATSQDGQALIVKVLRPGIEDTVRLDMHLMRWLAESLERYLPDLRIYHPVTLVEEFETMLLRELDFVNEAAATARFHEAFDGDPHIRIPSVHWDLSSSRVLTLDALSGENVATLVARDEPGLNPHEIAHRLADAYFKQFFEMGFFQTDPHPGNILVEPPASVGLIDFGQVATVTEELMTQLAVIVYAGVRREVEVVVDVLADMGALGQDTPRGQVERAVRSLLDKYYGLPMKRIDLGVLLEEFSDVMRRYDVTLPRELVLVIKTLATISGVIEDLDPSLNVVALLQPRLRGMIRERFSPRRMLRVSGVGVWHLMTTLRHAPRQMRRILTQMASGSWQFRLRHENLDHLTSELDRASNRLAFSVVIAAIIVGSSVVVSSNTQLAPLGIDIQYFGIAGYLIAGLLGLGLAWAIYRGGRLH